MYSGVFQRFDTLGGLSAHVVAYKDMNWLEFADTCVIRRNDIDTCPVLTIYRFVASLGLEREQWTTQISNYDNLGALMDAMKRINTYERETCLTFNC